MIEFADFIHFTTVALTVGINSMGVGIGEGLASSAAISAINIQPKAKNEITRTAILGSALIETSAIFGVTISFILLFGTPETANIYVTLAQIGIALSICLSGFIIGLVSSYPVREACFSIARQPFFAQPILRFMLIVQSIIQTPIIFGIIVAFVIKNQAFYCTSFAESLRLISSGLAIGLGSVGPAIGLAEFAKTACKGIGINRKAYTKLFSFTFISEAVIETPIIFALVIAMSLLVTSTSDNLLKAIAMFAAALVIGIGTIGPGISSGKTASSACLQIALHPEQHSVLAKVSLFSQGLIDTTAIYALVTGLLLILK